MTFTSSMSRFTFGIIVAFVALLILLVAGTFAVHHPAEGAIVEPRGEVTYGDRDTETPRCVTHNEWDRLHAAADLPLHYYVNRNLFGDESRTHAWHGSDGFYDAFGHRLCWTGNKLGKVKVFYSQSAQAYRVYEKNIVDLG